MIACCPCSAWRYSRSVLRAKTHEKYRPVLHQVLRTAKAQPGMEVKPQPARADCVQEYARSNHGTRLKPQYSSTNIADWSTLQLGKL